MGPFLGEVLAHDPPRGGVGARIGHLVQPLPELAVEVVQVAEAPGQEEVLAHVAERALDLALALGPVGAACPGLEAVVPGAGHQHGVVDHARLVLAADRRAHAVIQDLARHAAQCFKGGGVAAQHRLQVLVGDEPRPDQPRMPQHHGKQPHHPAHAGLGRELGAEMGEVHLRLLPRRGLEPLLEADRRLRAHGAQEVRELGISTPVAHGPQLAQQPARPQLGKSGHALAQTSVVGGKQGRPRRTRRVGRRLQPARDVATDRFAVKAGAPGDVGHAQPLAVQVKDHHKLSQSDHRRRLRLAEAISRRISPAPRARHKAQLGEFSPGMSGEYSISGYIR